MTLLFLNLGGGEVVLVVLVTLMFFGSKNIPTIARSLGKAMRELQDATDGIKREIEQSAQPVKQQMDQMHQEWNKTVDKVKKEVENGAEAAKEKNGEE